MVDYVEKGKVVDEIHRDFSMTFDTVPYSIHI